MHSRLSVIYNNMKQRCYNPNHWAFKNYGARGITICDEWNDRNWSGVKHLSKGYVAFRDWALSHGYQNDLTIDRIDVNKGYSPDNCRWVTLKEQCFNKRTNKYITLNGKTQTLTEWIRELGISRHAYYDRVKNGETNEEALQKKNNSEKLIYYKGKVQNIRQWCKELNKNYSTVKNRLLYLHWSVEKAFETD